MDLVKFGLWLSSARKKTTLIFFLQLPQINSNPSIFVQVHRLLAPVMYEALDTSVATANTGWSDQRTPYWGGGNVTWSVYMAC